MSCRSFATFSGCLLGGAVGDALGDPVEFLSLDDIRRRFGPHGVTGYTAINAVGVAEFTDDTQMTLFTAEGLLLARERGREHGIWSPPEMVRRAYMRWLLTQERPFHAPQGSIESEGWLIRQRGMWRVKAPGNTCLSALRAGGRGTPDQPVNNSKGCGGIMRVAPVGLLREAQGVPPGNPANAFALAVQIAAQTHGHPSGYLSAGVFAQVIAEIAGGQPLQEAIQRALATLTSYPNHEETLRAVQKALSAAASLPPTPETVETLGGGWVGEEALSIALFCALAHPTSFASGVLLAVNHSGDSDSTGAICGNLLGLLLGSEAIPQEWLEKIELREEIDNIAHKLLN